MLLLFVRCWLVAVVDVIGLPLPPPPLPLLLPAIRGGEEEEGAVVGTPADGGIRTRASVRVCREYM